MQYCRDHHPRTAGTVQCCAVVPGTCHVRENHALERLFQQHLDTETSESQLAKRLATMFMRCRRHAGLALIAQELSTTPEAAARRSCPPSSSQTNESHDVGRSRSPPSRRSQAAREEFRRGVPEGFPDKVRTKSFPCSHPWAAELMLRVRYMQLSRCSVPSRPRGDPRDGTEHLDNCM